VPFTDDTLAAAEPGSGTDPTPVPSTDGAAAAALDAEARADETEVLEAIFGEAYRSTSSAARCALDDDREVVVVAALPAAYPRARPRFTIESLRSLSALSCATRDDVRASASAAAAVCPPGICLFEAFSAALDTWRGLCDAAAGAAAAEEDDAAAATAAVELQAEAAAEVLRSESTTLSRRLIYSHHIISGIKRSAMRDLSHNLGVSALVKIGWPGIILLEGRREAVEFFVAVIQRWRWKRIVVRGEEDVEVGADVDAARAVVPPRWSEYDDMSVFAAVCEQAGLRELFMRIFK